MTKSELIKRISARFPNLMEKDIRLIVDSIFGEISAAMAKDIRVELRGFGAFTVRKRDARQARNPRTNEVVAIEPRATPYFRSGKELNTLLNSES